MYIYTISLYYSCVILSRWGSKKEILIFPIYTVKHFHINHALVSFPQSFRFIGKCRHFDAVWERNRMQGVFIIQLSSPTGLTFPGCDYEPHRGCLARNSNSLLLRSTCVHSRFLVEFVMFILLLLLHVCFVLCVFLSFFVVPFVSVYQDNPYCLTFRFSLQLHFIC